MAAFKIQQSGSVDLVMRELSKLPQISDKDKTKVTVFQLDHNTFNIDTLSSFHTYRNLSNLVLSNNSIDNKKLSHLSLPSSLEILDLSHNEINELALQGGVPSLRCLFVSHNRLSDPDSLHFMCDHLGSSLKKIDLSHNQLETLPQSFRKLYKLESVRLEGNPFPSFPLVLAALPSVTEIVLTVDDEEERWDTYDIERKMKRELMKFCSEIPNGKGDLNWGYCRGHVVELLDRLKSRVSSEDSVPNAGGILVNSAMITDELMRELEVGFREIPVLKSPTLLSLCTNKLTIAPPYIEKFVTLQQVGLCRNYLKELPATLRRLPRLKLVYITDNLIEDVHFSSGDFPSLNSLDLKGNPICQSRDKIVTCLAEWQKYGRGDLGVVKGIELPDVEDDSDDMTEEMASVSLESDMSSGSMIDEAKQQPRRMSKMKKGLMEVFRFYNKPPFVKPIETPMKVATKSVSKLQQSSITKLRHCLEIESSVTWRNLVTSFGEEMRLFDQGYIRMLEEEQKKSLDFSPVNRIVIDLASGGITIGELIKALLRSPHIGAAAEVAEIETAFIYEVYARDEEFAL